MRIDLYTVVPLLIESGNFMSIVDICLRKIKVIYSEGNINEE